MLSITFLFTEGSRVRVCFLLCALTFLGVGLSTLYLLAVLAVSSSFSPYTSLVDAYNGDHLVTVLTYLASVAILFNVLGLYVSYTAMYPERRAQSRIKTLAMTLAQLCLVAAFAWSSYICYIYAEHVNESFKGGLTKSMRRYRDNVDVKRTLDRLQSVYECCGDNTYTDWFRVSWVPDEFVDTRDPDVRDRVRSGYGYRSDDVPFSCCSRAVRRPCITQFIHDNKQHFNYDYQKDLTVHVEGCRDALSNHVRTWLFLGLCIATSVCLLLQAIVVVLLRYLQTSIELAVRSGDPTADSLAYLLSVCLPYDDMTDDRCPPRPVSAGVAPSVAPSFASSMPPIDPAPSATAQTLRQAAATLEGLPPGVAASQVNASPDAAGVVAALCPRVPVPATAVNNSARVDPRPAAGVLPSSRSSVVGVSLPYGRCTPITVPGTPHSFT